jgi:hypothetical protein
MLTEETAHALQEESTVYDQLFLLSIKIQGLDEEYADLVKVEAMYKEEIKVN